MAGLADISGGRADYGYSSPSRSLFDDLAAKAMQVQEVPVAPQMGYSMPSAPVSLASPFTNLAWRTVPNLFGGGLGVQPLVGAPSTYPWVLSGTPDSFMRWIPMLQAMMPPMQPLQWPQQKQGKAVQPTSSVSAGAQASTTTTPVRQNGQTTTTPPAPQRTPIKLTPVQQIDPDIQAITPQAPEGMMPMRSVTGELIGYQSEPRVWDWITGLFRQIPDSGASDPAEY